jgi:aconitate hydratase 2/2-methylisocitrate dehydratase|tara:strand:+ start:5442 stop:8006 length:2565 start_codon:yes stop_codon:yes gene_type:complete
VLEAYRKHVTEREREGIVPKSLSPDQVKGLIELLRDPPDGEQEFLLDLLSNRIPAGVDEAAEIKAAFLFAVAEKREQSPLLNAEKATQLLGTMLGGYNVQPLISLLDSDELAETAVAGLRKTLLVFDAFQQVTDLSQTNSYAKAVLESWANAEWFTGRPKVADKITVTVFKVEGETNTDDLSPAGDAWSRPDIPLHARSMLAKRMENPLDTIAELKQKGHPIAYVGDVVGTGSSRKSATNSVLWHIGNDIPFIPNKRDGSICLGGSIAPIFFNTMEDAGALPIECDVTKMNMGDVISIYPYDGKIVSEESGETLADFGLSSDVLLDEVQAGGRIPLIIGRSLTTKARLQLGLEPSTAFRMPTALPDSAKGYTLAQKIVGRACGVEGVRAGSYCEPSMATVGSQDTTGPMTRDELKELACLDFSADLVMQSFCHTAAYPKSVDIETQHTLPVFFESRGGVALHPKDGIIHSWLNRMLLPDTVGTGGDSHTRFPMGISFPAGSGLVAFAAALGVMPLDMPESVLVRYKGEMQPGITLRDLVNAIPYCAIQQGLLTVEKEGKKNVFSGRILEIEGLPDLKVEQAFELSDASAERSAGGCSIRLNKEPLIEYMSSNVTLLKYLISEGYGNVDTLQRRIRAMLTWIDSGELLVPDEDAEYAAVLEIDLHEITEPLLACPNDPDDVRPLSQVAGTGVDEVFIGSCMTNIGHFRAAAQVLSNSADLNTRLWVAPPTKMDEHQLREEGVYAVFAEAGARTEVPGCSLCMGNQARVAANSTTVSTSTRNFPNRLGDGANVYLASAEVAVVAAILGELPSLAQYMEYTRDLDSMSAEIYRYLNFHQIEAYRKATESILIPAANV